MSWRVGGILPVLFTYTTHQQRLIVSDFDKVEEAEKAVFQAIEEMNRARSHEQSLIEQANQMAEQHNLEQVKKEYGARTQGAIEETTSAENRVIVALQEAGKAWKRLRDSQCPDILD